MKIHFGCSVRRAFWGIYYRKYAVRYATRRRLVINPVPMFSIIVSW
jgi:hypothetical protein